MMNITLLKDLEKAFTEMVSEYIAKGMMIHLNSMSGTQGEKAKVDLTDGKDVYRIRLERESCFDDEFWGDKMVLIVEKHSGADKKDLDNWDTIWNNKGEEVYRKEWFSVSNRRNKAFVETLEEARECTRKQRDRYHSRLVDKDVKEIKVIGEDRLTALRDICRNRKGYARIKRCHIDKLTKCSTAYRTSYIVSFNNGKKDLVIKNISK